MSFYGEVIAQVFEVVNLPVVHGPHSVERHGLVPGGSQVENGKPLVPQPDAAAVVDKNPTVVGTPVIQRIPHRFEHSSVYCVTKLPNANDTAHTITISPVRGLSFRPDRSSHYSK